MERPNTQISKFLSLVLRHQPESIGLSLDERGWANIDDLLDAANRTGTTIDRNQLLQVVENNDKRRFSLSDDGTMIRANQGHSILVDLELSPVSPPDRLFHGTVERFLDSIREQGLRPGARQHVHLSKDVATATTVGKRRGKPVILTIRSAVMHADGLDFFLSANGVWLTASVPVDYIEFP